MGPGQGGRPSADGGGSAGGARARGMRPLERHRAAGPLEGARPRSGERGVLSAGPARKRRRQAEETARRGAGEPEGRDDRELGRPGAEHQGCRLRQLSAFPEAGSSEPHQLRV